ncbi:FtsW/RodA/SpoVE family cell cycle protein [Listeria cossartiae subsp. cayugensis]|uniref:FtsW/RodA/SpoVE family cell cycle protein n=1 Tax=Listeria cossartiae TaxID=2838249 RepID=UPI0028806D8A|nr:FtsW/RodA/SpoVE family cell cycle protein [Listeria cossartiae]MDT0001127.1 FtsW/RodA/SpoVE family cell cycle protein [Listeria cossartiae subsp. cayugensis]MDT0002095.1 FtsW/RodA/SpoVE family cell cycle protein [Listeria cossartiae subsp. cayugensis]MDT0009651.1 FtsW/RodA/SpoVE family cell cycle protein [Listeria cossartiae subsp. cayugensis]MDT0019536.1 FtsW/RodA/SpoVE family cell cycle protein [Listeria cossartiae subsp. cayugensis]MDT0031157.1 FtsW/RodA/SpoVE family cell cycle protein [
MSSSKFEAYLSKVISKVKSKQAHSMIKKELSNHLEELSRSFQNRGLSIQAADKKAMQEMGDPSTVGRNMNQLHKPRMDWLLIALFVLLAGISFLPLIGGASVLSSSFMKKQIVWLVIATLALIGFLFFDYRKLKNLWMYFYGAALILFFTPFLVGISLTGGGRWMSLWGIAIDSPAISLFLFFIAWAGIFTKVNAFKGWKEQVMLLILFWAPVISYIMINRFVFGIMYFLCVLVMYIFYYRHNRFAIKVALGNLLVGIIFISTMILKYPSSYLPDTSIPLKDVLSKAGWFGKGLHNNLALPEAHTDFVFPFLVYSLGWLFGISLCLLLVVFILRISLNAFKTKDLFGRLLTIGGAVLFTVPACWNILMGLGIVPMMVVPLPFISYGGSMLLIYAALLGLILNVYRRKDIVESTLVN